MAMGKIEKLSTSEKFNMVVKNLENIVKLLEREREGKNEVTLETYRQATSEKQEDWREELGKLMSLWGKVLYINKGRIGKGMQMDMRRRFEDFISKLLSERTFTSEDLQNIKIWAHLCVKGGYVLDKSAEKTREKVWKLCCDKFE